MRGVKRQNLGLRLFVASILVLALGACSNAATQQNTTAAQSMFNGLPIDGIRCDTMEGAAQHIHAQLQLFDHGRIVKVPAQIGIPKIGTCLYWLHTHTADGIIHVESPVKHRSFTLGQFFDVWGMDLNRSQADGLRAPAGSELEIWVNGKLFQGDPRSIVLHDRQEIVMQVGPPYGKPAKYDWSQL
jgi:hypothetical protein